MAALSKKSQIVAAMKAATMLYTLDLIDAATARSIIDKANGFDEKVSK